MRFSETVHASGEPTLELAVGGSSRFAALSGGSGTDELSFRYVVRTGDYDRDGISIGPGAASLAGGTIADAADNAAVRDFEALPADPRHTVNARVAAVVRVEIVNGPKTYAAGEPIEIDVEFTRDVHVTGSPVLALSVGEDTVDAGYVAGSGTRILRFAYAVRPGDHDDDGVSIAADALAGGTIADDAGNAADRGFEALPADPRHTVDARIEVAAVTGIEVATAPGGIRLLPRGRRRRPPRGLRHARPCHRPGRPAALGRRRDARRPARRRQRDVVAHLPLHGAARRPRPRRRERRPGRPRRRHDRGRPGTAGRARDLPPLPPDRTLRIDARGPVVEDVRIDSDPGRDRTYAAGDPVDVVVTFDEPVYATGAPVLALSIGADTLTAALADGGGTKALRFRYVVAAGDHDMDGVSIPANALSGGTIADVADNPADRTFAALEADDEHLVDALPPSIAEVRFSSDAGPDRTYTPGDVVELSVVFTEAVHVGGVPMLALNVGADVRQAEFAAGSGTAELAFRYTVRETDYDDDGISIAANALTGGTLADAGGNVVDRTFDALAPDGDHKVGLPAAVLLPELTLTVGVPETLDLAAAALGVGFRYDGAFVAASDTPDIATASATGGLLTIVPVAEGSAFVTAVAATAPIALVLPVVVEASAAEAAVLGHALASVGRSLLSSAAGTIAARLESAGRPAPVGNMPPLGGRAAGVRADDGLRRSPFDAAGMPSDARFAAGGGRTMRRSFSMPLTGIANPARSWGLWGAGDVQAFEGDPAEGGYDGSLRTAHIGLDARGDGWVAGASVSRSRAEVSYAFSGVAAGEGDLAVDLTAIHPYVQWSPDERVRFWAIAGFGSGEASAARRGTAGTGRAGDLSMRLGIAGLRVDVGDAYGYELALRGDAGLARLETGDGVRALDGLLAATQRVRVGVEASRPVPLGNGALMPFVEVGGRLDAGDGATGLGVELVGGVRYRASGLGLEAKARTLALHADGGYGESGFAATVFFEPEDAAGLHFSLSPQRGLADSTDVFWQQHYAPGDAYVLRRDPNAWRVDGEVAYGFALARRPGIVAPFAEADLGGRAGDSVGIGLRYAAEARGTVDVEVSAHRTTRADGQADGRLLLTAKARF